MTRRHTSLLALALGLAPLVAHAQATASSAAGGPPPPRPEAAPAAPVPPGHPPLGAAPGPVDPDAPVPPGHPPVGVAPGPVDPDAPVPPGHPPMGAPGPVDPDAPVPPGHPPLGAAPAPVDPDVPVPPGHPPMGGAAGAAEPGGTPEADQSVPAPDLRAGTIQVHLRDGRGQPLPRHPVRLGIMKQDVAQGDSRSEREGVTSDDGVVTFDGLDAGTAFSYRVTAQQGPGTFASAPIRLGEAAGHRVLLHVYPVTSSLEQALVGMRGVIFVAAREDVFQLETSFQVLNIGRTAWVPSGVKIPLPEGAKAFRAADAMEDTRFDRTGDGPLELLGTFTPGQHDVGYQFQLGNEHERRKVIRIPLPPHLAELRVVAEGVKGLVLSADGFPEAEPMKGQDGTPLLVTGRRLSRGDPAMASVEITLDNLPVPSVGRWYAVALALGIAGIGVGHTLQRRGRRVATSAEEAREAEELILDELVALERLWRGEQIGPRTYQEARLGLLDALARIQARKAEAGAA